MKKILMLVAAFVIGSGVLGTPTTAFAQEVSRHSNPQDTTAVQPSGMAFIASIKADSTFVNRCLEDIPRVLEAHRNATKQRIDSLSAVNNRPIVADSLRIANEEAVSEDVKSQLHIKVVKWGGRNRYGKFTDQCAAHANGRLGRAGYYAQGHAYQVVSYFPSVINGYSKVTIPDLTKVSAKQRFSTVLNMHREAADYVKEHLDMSKLVVGKYYLVNMYYSTSPYMLEFFYAARKECTRNYGTHVGVLYYSSDYETWIVEHNIHGHVYYDALESILGGKSNPRKYGVTSISRVSK